MKMELDLLSRVLYLTDGVSKPGFPQGGRGQRLDEEDTVEVVAAQRLQQVGQPVVTRGRPAQHAAPICLVQARDRVCRCRIRPCLVARPELRVDGDEYVEHTS